MKDYKKLKVGMIFINKSGELIEILGLLPFLFDGDWCVKTKILERGTSSHKVRRKGCTIGTSVGALDDYELLPKIKAELIK